MAIAKPHQKAGERWRLGAGIRPRNWSAKADGAPGIVERDEAFAFAQWGDLPSLSRPRSCPDARARVRILVTIWSHGDFASPRTPQLPDSVVGATGIEPV